MTHEIEKPGSRFWSRPDIMGAQRAMDVWGTVKRHWQLGGQGIPSLDWIDMVKYKAVEDRIVCRAEQWLNEAKSPPNCFPDGKLSKPLLIAFGVDAVLSEFENPPVLHALMLHRYPVDGPLCREEKERAYRRFRPEPFMRAVVGQLRGKHIEWRIDQLLAQLERDFLEHLAHCGVRR